MVACVDCKFFVSLAGPGIKGECRFDPPVVVAFRGSKQPSLWPIVKETWSCGKGVAV